MSLDHRYYPHIIDLVFDSAPTDALLVLRNVCHDWRRRVMARFRHLHEFTAIADPAGSAVEIMFKPRPGDEVKPVRFRLDPAVPGQLAGCRVLDLHPDADADAVRAVFADQLPDLHTLRYTGPPPAGLDVPDSVHTVVLENLLPPRHVFMDSGFKKLVVNAREDTGQRGDASGQRARDTLPPPVREVVLTLSPTDSDGQSAAFSWAMYLSALTRRVSVPFTVAGELDGMGRSNLAQYMGTAPDVAWPDGETKRQAQWVTLDEYGDRVGEKIFAIETDFTNELDV